MNRCAVGGIDAVSARRVPRDRSSGLHRGPLDRRADSAAARGGTAARRRLRAGLSLLEVLLVLAVAGVLGGSLAAVAPTGARSAAFDAGAATLRDALVEARQVALARGSVVRLVFPVADEASHFGVYWLVVADDSGAWLPIGGVRSLPERVGVRRAGSGMGAARADDRRTSQFSGRAAFAVAGVAAAGRVWDYVEFRSGGTALPSLVVLAPPVGVAGEEAGEAAAVAAGVRGLRVSIYGTVTLLPGDECF